MILISFPVVAIAQQQDTISRSIYQSVPELQLVDTLNWSLLKDKFSTGGIMVSYIIQLDSNHTYRYSEFSDMADIVLSRGTWHISGGNVLVLQSGKNKWSFDVARYGRLLFYIETKYRADFVADFKKELQTIGGDSFSNKQAIIRWHLAKKYYSTE